MNEVLVCQIGLLLILALVNVVMLLYRTSKRSLSTRTLVITVTSFFIRCPVHEEFNFPTAKRGKSLSLKPSLKSGGWSGPVPTEVKYITLMM